VPRSYKEENWGQESQLIFGSQFCTGLEHVSREIIVVNTHYQEMPSENIAEEYPLLEAVTRRGLQNTLQVGSFLVFAVVFC
jgi:hypothetical protein